MVININNKPITVEVKYSKRKTVFLRIITRDNIEIRAPFGLSTKKILDFLVKNESWIWNKLSKAQVNLKTKSYKDGESFYCQGQVCTLKVTVGSREYVFEEKSDNTIRLECRNIEDVKSILIKWYKNKAESYIKERVSYYQNIIGVEYGNISIKNQKTIWGSCSSKKNLNFNLKLIMMPEYIIDYVVVHEICHLIHFNHSKEFWKKVEEFVPDYKERRQYLKQNSGKYYI